MLLILDTCNVGVRKEPKGGFVLLFTDIEGLPGTSVMVPVETKDNAQTFIDEVQSTIGPRVQTATLVDMKRTVRDEPQG